MARFVLPHAAFVLANRPKVCADLAHACLSLETSALTY